MVLLWEPNPDDTLFSDAAMMFKSDKAKYENKAEQWTKQYAMQ